MRNMKTINNFKITKKLLKNNEMQAERKQMEITLSIVDNNLHKTSLLIQLFKETK